MIDFPHLGLCRLSSVINYIARVFDSKILCIFLNQLLYLFYTNCLPWNTLRSFLVRNWCAVQFKIPTSNWPTLVNNNSKNRWTQSAGFYHHNCIMA